MGRRTETQDSGIDVNTGKPASTSAGKLFGINTIHGPDGPYMTRAWIGRLRLHIFHRGDLDPDCHDHPWDFWTFPLTPYVEEVITERPPMGDGEGHIIEWAPDDLVRERYTQIVPAWRWSFRPAEHCHRVLGRFGGYAWNLGTWEMEQGLTAKQVGRNVYLEPEHEAGRIITLVWVSKPRRKWGFLKNRDDAWCWIGWREYVFGGGKNGPCE